MDRIELPDQVKFIMQRLLDHGYQAYVVGGSIRDTLLHRRVADYDITTSAHPEEIKQVFSDKKIIDFGARHGTVAVRHKRRLYEITTFRVESEYSDGRRPDTVQFVANLDEDLARRDFTINAMAADIHGSIIDPFHGVEDIQRKLIRAVREPKLRFEEDSLRILRACRFSLRFSYKIEVNTYTAMKETMHLIDQHSISPERIATEMKEIIMYGKEAIHLLHKLGLIDLLFPGISEINFSLTLNRFDLLGGANMELNYALLFHEYLKLHETHELFNRIVGYGKYTEEYIEILSKAVIPSTIIEYAGEQEIIRWLHRISNPIRRKKEFIADKLLTDILVLNTVLYEKKLEFDDIFAEKFALLDRKLPVNGNDAKAIGFRGKQISAILDQWTQMMWRNPNQTREDYLDFVTYTKQKADLDVLRLRNEISNDVPKFTEEEDETINLEVNRYLILFDNVKIIASKRDLSIIKNNQLAYFYDGRIQYQNNQATCSIENLDEVLSSLGASHVISDTF
ncbi:MAG: hypothetical protein INQ03_18575 [Candidatus Heimdallarchaeota archaeon]|nr:hypothetical protein [Candidatus Heimdallarchaeota archaeon]